MTHCVDAVTSTSIQARPHPHLTGRERLEAIRDGFLDPPALTKLMDFRITVVGDGETEFVIEPRDALENGAGLIHGGVAAAMLDTALGAAIQTRLPAGVRSTTLSLNLSYQRPVTQRSGLVTARGRATRIGRTHGFAEGVLMDAGGSVCVAATATFAITDIGQERSSKTDPGN